MNSTHALSEIDVKSQKFVKILKFDTPDNFEEAYSDFNANIKNAVMSCSQEVKGIFFKELLEISVNGFGSNAEEAHILAARRSFAVLALADLVRYDRQYGDKNNESHNVIKSDDKSENSCGFSWIKDFSNTAVSFLNNESCTIGYFKDKFWIHGFAHVGDLCLQLSLHHRTSADAKKRMNLSIMQSLLRCKSFDLIHGELWRLAKAYAVSLESIDESELGEALKMTSLGAEHDPAMFSMQTFLRHVALLLITGQLNSGPRADQLIRFVKMMS